eukprot:scaffold28180_cov129-Isochrysis_galbana.AAC.1
MATASGGVILYLYACVLWTRVHVGARVRVLGVGVPAMGPACRRRGVEDERRHPLRTIFEVWQKRQHQVVRPDELVAHGRGARDRRNPGGPRRTAASRRLVAA